MAPAALAYVDGCTGAGRQLVVSGDEIGVQMRLEDMADLEILLLRCLQINLNITLRIDDDGFAFRSQHVRGVCQTAQIELFEVHGFSCAQNDNPKGT